MQVIPAVDVLDGQVVRLHQGRYDEVTVYDADPAARVAAFGETGAPLVHVVDLAAARRGVVTDGLWSRLVASGVDLQAGGGVRTPAVAAALVGVGVARVVVGTAAVRNDGTLPAIVDEVGSARVVVGLDVRDGRVRGSGWTDEGERLEVVVERLLEARVVRVLVTGIQTDGTKAGPDRALLRRVASLAPDLAIIASGGVGTLEHLRVLAADGYEAAIVGRALYDGEFTLAEAVQAGAG